MMQNSRTKEVVIFFTALAVIGFGLFEGVAYMKGAGGGSNTASLLADVSGVVAPHADTSTVAVATAEASTTTTTTVATTSTTKVTVVTKPKPKPKPKPQPAPVVAKTNPAPKPTVIVQPTAVVQTQTPTPTPEPVQNISATQSLPYSIGTFGSGFVNGDGWTTWWGKAFQTGGVLDTGASTSTTGGGALFLPSDSWTNYTFQANIDWIKGETFGVVARYTNDKNYIVCEFDAWSPGNVDITLEEFVNGKQTNLAKGTIQNYNQVGGANMNVSIEAQGNQAVCGWNGHAISTLIAGTVLSPSLSTGGIGFATWDKTQNNSEIIVHTLGAVPGVYNLGVYDDQT